MNLFPFLGLVFVVVLFGILSKGSLFSERGLRSMLNDGLYIFVGAAGYVFILAQGELDFSIGSIMGVSCAAACLAARVNVWLALPVAVLTGSLISLVNAFVVAVLNVNSFITTLAMQYICNGLVLVVLEGGILSAPLNMLAWYSNTFKVCLFVVFLIAGYFIFEHTRYGKIVKSLGSSREAVHQSGANVLFYKMMPFVVMGMIMGLLGFVSLIRTGSASSTTGASVMMNVLNAVLIGGAPFSGGTTSKFRAAVIGSLTITILSCGMAIIGVGTLTQQFIKGMVFLVAVSLSFDRRNLKVIK